MARSPFRRDALSVVRKPTADVTVDRGSPIALGLRSVFLFEDRRFTDSALDARSITRRGSIATARGIHGGQVHSALTASSGTFASPCLVLSPEDAATSALTVSALVRFSGVAPSGGAYNALGGGLISDDAGRMPLYLSVSGGSFRTHVPADTEFLSGGQHLLAASLNGWHRLTVTVTGSTATLYVDGGTTWTGIASQAFANFSLRALLGSDVSAGTEWPFPVADIFYWNRALSSDEVAAHARRPYAVLRSPLADRWVAAVLPSPAPAATGNPFDDIFSDEFGPSVPLGTTAQAIASGGGSLSATANVVRALGVTAQIDGGGFLHLTGMLVRPGRTTFAGGATINATGTASSPNQANATIAGAGALVATTGARYAASATFAGSASITAATRVTYKALTAQQGVGALTANGTWRQANSTASATIVGAGNLVATTRMRLRATARFAGSGSLTSTYSGAPAVTSLHMKANGYGRLIAQAHVRRKPHVRPGIANGVAPEIIRLEVETYVPGNVPVTVTFGHGTRAHGTLSRQPPTQLEKTGMIYASDIGYRTAPGDQGGPQPYPPLLNDAYQIDVALALEPAKTSAAAAWGSILLANPNKQFDTIAAVQNSDGRPVTIMKGTKVWDADRQYFTDPIKDSFSRFFSALAAPWALTDDGLQIPIRDVSYFLEKPIQTDLYGGHGGSDGTPDLAGKPKPMARGGYTGYPIQNITPTLVDPVALVYQYNDGPGQLINLYEAGATGAGAITPNSLNPDVTDLWSGTTNPGHYRTDNSRGLFQLGSVPVGQITADVIGHFTKAGWVYNPFEICRYLLAEDAQLDASMIDDISFVNIRAAHSNYIGGVYFGSDEAWSCVQAVDSALASFGANLVPTRDGKIRLTLLRAIDPAEPVVATYDEAQIVAITRRALPQTLDPPPYRFRVGFNHNFTIQSSGINTSLTPATRQQFVVSPDRFATWYDPGLLAAYRRPNDYDAMPGPMLSPSDVPTAVQQVADELGALWGVKRRLYEVTLPRRMFGCEIGDVVHLRYPIEQLAGGQDGRVVGYSLRATDATVIYSVLV